MGPKKIAQGNREPDYGYDYADDEKLTYSKRGNHTLLSNPNLG